MIKGGQVLGYHHRKDYQIGDEWLAAGRGILTESALQMVLLKALVSALAAMGASECPLDIAAMRASECPPAIAVKVVQRGPAVDRVSGLVTEPQRIPSS